MFQSLTSILTLSAMLLHSILGCCSHHAHACEHGHVVEVCVAGQNGHHSEAGHHGHGDHHHGELAGQVAVCGGPAVANEDGVGDHESHECPHGPCGFECEGEDCSFTQSSEVKVPDPGDGGLWFPLAISNEFVSPVAESLLTGRHADAGPPRASAACCCRTMTQVWRL